MLSWSASPFTNWRSGEPRPGTGVALYELERSKLYSVGLNRTLITLPWAAPLRTVMVAFLSCVWLIAASQTSALARNPDAALNAANHVVGQSIQLTGVKTERAGLVRRWP